MNSMNSKLFAADIDTMTVMPTDASTGRTSNRESILRAFGLSANKLLFSVDNFKRNNPG